jgi:hypothetical protein
MDFIEHLDFINRHITFFSFKGKTTRQADVIGDVKVKADGEVLCVNDKCVNGIGNVSWFRKIEKCKDTN